MLLNLILIILGFVLLSYGANFLIDGSSSIAKKFKIPTLVIGLTIVALGTSMPELAVGIVSAAKGHSDIVLGNVIGSNLINMLLILGICAAVKPVKINERILTKDSFISIFAVILLAIVCKNNNIISRIEGLILFTFFILYILYNIYMAKHNKDNEEENNIKEMSFIKSCIYIVLGILGLKFGGDLVVNYASEIARAIGITERIISITIVAISTSLPELITSIDAIKKDEADLSLGNIIGSGIFNILCILGVSSIISPIQYAESYNNDLALLMILTSIFSLLPLFLQKKMITRLEGVLLIMMYIGYIYVLFVI